MIINWEFEKYHSFSTLFNEDVWLTLSIEYGKIKGIELGVTFKDDERYLWPDEIDQALIKDVDNSTNTCDECGSLFFKSKSMMISMCPECASAIYNYENCDHSFEEGRCKYCYWDRSKSNYVIKKAST